MIMALESLAGSQSARQVTTQSPMLRISVLTRPIISATMPAKTLPTTEPAFMIASAWNPNSYGKPFDEEYDVM